MILVARHLKAAGVAIQHIHEDGSLETMTQAEDRLVRLFFPDACHLFLTPAQMLEEAYDRQAERIQYAEPARDPRG